MQLSRNQRTGINVAAAVRERMRRTGMTNAGHYLWSEEEVATLRRLYPDYNALVEALPRRTRFAIIRKAATLGIAKPLRIWLPDEFASQAKRSYIAGDPVREIAERLRQKTPKQVYGQAR